MKILSARHLLQEDIAARYTQMVNTQNKSISGLRKLGITPQGLGDSDEDSDTKKVTINLTFGNSEAGLHSSSALKLKPLVVFLNRVKHGTHSTITLYDQTNSNVLQFEVAITDNIHFDVPLIAKVDIKSVKGYIFTDGHTRIDNTNMHNWKAIRVDNINKKLRFGV